MPRLGQAASQKAKTISKKDSGIGVAEMMNFPNIPVNVTINEYVDLAKLYSTPRSGSYINGMLDAIARYLIDTGKMMKVMPTR